MGERGRPKGSLNVRSLTVRQWCEEKGYNPISEIHKIAAKNPEDPELQRKCHSDIAKYVWPQLKAVEISGSLDHGLRGMSQEQLTTLLVDLVGKLKK
jgi:hypothetical protein